MLTKEQLHLLRDISQSIAFSDESNRDAESLILDGYVMKAGDIYELTPKGVATLEEHTNLALQPDARPRATNANFGMPPLAEEYRCKAKETEALAEAAQDQLVKEVYLEVAQRWRELADRAERNNW
jgi:DNA-binding PadR family transcriptional regulator